MDRLAAATAMTVDYLNPPDELLYQPIEPWTPRVGDRVRVVINPECRLRPHPESYEPATAGLLGHYPFENGRVGTVVLPENAVDGDAEYFAAQGHPYLVEYDIPFVVADFTCTMDFYAACELELMISE